MDSKGEELVHPQPKREEPVRPQPKREEPMCPQPKRGKAERLQPTSLPAEEENLLFPPPPAEGECLLVLPGVAAGYKEGGGETADTKPGLQREASPDLKRTKSTSTKSTAPAPEHSVWRRALKLLPDLPWTEMALKLLPDLPRAEMALKLLPDLPRTEMALKLLPDLPWTELALKQSLLLQESPLTGCPCNHRL
ncbi:UNVERIFIED_CONTAM: hypothetical protein FKN15_060499 [Acipenser sinensis]